MKIGSLVVCIDNKNPQFPGVMPELDVIYTVRAIPWSAGVYLEEIVSGYIDGVEIGFLLRRFREVLPPIEDIEECIKENSLELQEL